MATLHPSAKAIFDEVAELASPEDRRDFLDRACVDAPKLRQQVEALLAAYDQASSFLEQPVMQPPAITSSVATDSVGAVIGPYKLIELIGEGGMGTVWMAQQQEPVKRVVALKLIKAGMDSKQVIARFEAERQALALMDHPNIAKVLDASTTEAGRPYFVMDLVKGVPITRYCDAHHLTPSQRLELFIPVCHAVQHAHQKGIIHRDLKPSNVLVALYDGKPVPKVIDFGVAKAAGQPLTEQTLITGFGAIVGTLEYMSPEQAEINQLDIDTRSDVYSLGVLLYELLTGSPPFSRQDLEKAGLLEMRRVIREQEPSKPSTKLSTAERLPTLAANRGTEPAKLTKLVRGELDWIVMKALEKDRNRRYETANSLAMDVQRYLADEPVQACPPTTIYRLRKFACRNRGLLTAATVVVLLLTAGIVALTFALVEVNREWQEKVTALEAEGKRRKQTRAALDAMSSLMIDDWLSKQKVLLPEHKKFLEQMLHDYEEFAADTGQDTEIREGMAQAYRRVGMIRLRLGQHQDSKNAFNKCLEIYTKLCDEYPRVSGFRVELARCYQNLGAIAEYEGQGQEALNTWEKVLSIQRSLVADFPGVPEYQQRLGEALVTRGTQLKNVGRLSDAKADYNEAITITSHLVDQFPHQDIYRFWLARAFIDLGLMFHLEGQAAEADRCARQGIANFVQLVKDYPNITRYREALAISQNNLGNWLRSADRHSEAETIFRDCLTTRRELVDEFPAVPEYLRGLAMTLNNLGIVLKDKGQVADAEELYRQALAVHQRLAADYPKVMGHRNEVAGAMSNLARMLLARNEPLAARKLLEEALPYHQAALAANPNHPDFRGFFKINRRRMAETLLALRDHEGAAKATEEFLQLAVDPPRDTYTAAWLMGSCVQSATQDERLAESKRKELGISYGDKAIAALPQALELKSKDLAELAKDPRFDPLRQRDDFRALSAEWEAKNKPIQP